MHTCVFSPHLMIIPRLLGIHHQYQSTSVLRCPTAACSRQITLIPQLCEVQFKPVSIFGCAAIKKKEPVLGLSILLKTVDSVFITSNRELLIRRMTDSEFPLSLYHKTQPKGCTQDTDRRQRRKEISNCLGPILHKPMPCR